MPTYAICSCLLYACIWWLRLNASDTLSVLKTLASKQGNSDCCQWQLLWFTTLVEVVYGNESTSEHAEMTKVAAASYLQIHMSGAELCGMPVWSMWCVSLLLQCRKRTYQRSFWSSLKSSTSSTPLASLGSRLTPLLPAQQTSMPIMPGEGSVMLSQYHIATHAAA